MLAVHFFTAVALAFNGQGAAVPPAVHAPPPNHRYGIVKIPALHEKETIYVGTEAAQIDRGIGHLRGSRWPGQDGLVSLWGHRVTPVPGTFIHTRNAGPFRNIDDLHRGDRIIVKMPYGRFVYRVSGHRIIADGKIGTGPRRFLARAAMHRGPSRLAIAACHPPGSAAYRYVVFARPA